ncbi:MAG TPA: sensor histidine kinase [Armatimonadota bacterium]
MTTSTYFAPAERADATALHITRESFLANTLAVSLLDSIPTLAVVLNRERQIIAVNHRLLETLGIADPEGMIGLRPGEVVSCVHAADGPGGCGTGPSCAFCGAVNAILLSLDSMEMVTRECRIQTQSQEDGGALDLEVQASYLNIDDHDLVLLALRDISAEKRRQVLERVFFHDVLNTASGIQAITQLMGDPDEDPVLKAEYAQDLGLLTQQIIEEITAQRQLLAAERGELQLNLADVPVRDLLEQLYGFYRHHHLTRYCALELGNIPDSSLLSDAMLLRRILGNLVKNALEATEPGGTVTISAEESGDRLAFHVYDPGIMPEEIQQQLFQRSFSTKGGSGRGIGTYSVKLFTERYLQGKVEFTSKEPTGTTFSIVLPNAEAK